MKAQSGSIQVLKVRQVAVGFLTNSSSLNLKKVYCFKKKKKNNYIKE